MAQIDETPLVSRRASNPHRPFTRVFGSAGGRFQDVKRKTRSLAARA